MSAAKRRAFRLPCMAAGIVLLCGQAAAQVPDAERGRLLYENHCIVCHTDKVHRRIPPLPIDIGELRRIVAAWATFRKLNWSAAEIEDVTRYLDRNHYGFER